MGRKFLHGRRLEKTGNKIRCASKVFLTSLISMVFINQKLIFIKDFFRYHALVYHGVLINLVASHQGADSFNAAVFQCTRLVRRRAPELMVVGLVV